MFRTATAMTCFVEQILPTTKLVECLIMSQINMNRGDGDLPLTNGFVVGMRVAFPGDSGSRNPVILPSTRIDLLHDRTFKPATAERRQVYTCDGCPQTIRDIDVEKRLLR
jgi:hypothetical protein